MAVRSTGNTEEWRIDSAEWHELFKATRDFDTALYRELRSALRKAGGPIVTDVRAEIGKIPSRGVSKARATHKLKSGKRITLTEGGIRTRLQAGTRVGILASSARTAGIRIVTSPNKLPASKRALAKAMNKPTFRHPVFDTGGWVEQSGRPYFGAVIGKHADEVRDDMKRAFLRTAAQLPNWEGRTT